MNSAIQTLGINLLSRDERIALVLEIWDSIAAEPAPLALTETQRGELQLRVAEDEASPEDVVPWEQVHAEAQRRLQP